MFALVIETPQETREVLIAELWEAHVAGIVEGEGAVHAFFEDDAQAAELQARFGGRIEAADDRDWVAVTQEALQPMSVGQRFFLVPEWRDDPAPEGRIRIRVNSGLAFGTGAHESTRLCLEALEELVSPGAAVVDVGTGSGILAEAAKKLGAGRVVACDIDPLSIEVAGRNFAEAGVQVELFEGSVQQIPDGTADLTIANISPEWLVLLAADWVRVTRDNGTLLLSGLEEHDFQRVRERVEAAGAFLREVRKENQWRALIFDRRPAR